MAKTRLTKTVVDQIPHPTTGQLLIRDTQLLGFGLRVGTRAKSYFVEGQVAGRTVRATVGRADLLHPDIARKKAASMLVQMSEGTDPNRSSGSKDIAALTLRDAFVAFFGAKQDLALSTVSGYTRTLDLYLLDWSDRPLITISRQMVIARHKQLCIERGEVTANNVMRHLRSVYNFAAANYDDLPPNPVTILSQARAWGKEKRRRTLVTPHQLPGWWMVVISENEDARDVLLMALFTGMRRSEITGLQWENLNFATRTLRLPTTKNGDPLELPMSNFVCELLSSRRERVGQTQWVFPSRSASGHIQETKSFTRRVSQKLGAGFTMHDLRRTFITVAESLDITAYSLKRLLNHRLSGDVTGGYIVISAERLREPAERIASKLLELADGAEALS